MNTATKTLFVFGSISMVQSQASPTRDATANNRWPKYPASVVASNGASASGMAAADLTSNAINERAAKNNDGAGTVGGFYNLFRFDDVYVYPLQGIVAQAGDTDNDVKEAPTLGVLAAGTKTFYMTTAATGNDALWAGPITLATGTAAADVRTANASTVVGNRWGACLNAQLADQATTVTCSSIQANVKKSSGNSAGDYQNSGGIPGRIYMGALDTATDDNAVGDTDIEAAYRSVKSVFTNWDLVMGSFYQMNGTTNTSTWCQVSSGADSAAKIKFSTEVASAATVVLKANNGLGPRTKCTWQVTAADNSSGPMFQLDVSANNQYLLQVIEWYDTTKLGTNAVLSATKAVVTGSAGNSPYAATNTDYASGGVYFNPVADLGDMAATSMVNTDWQYCVPASQDNAALNQAGSIGTALYYDRVTGQGKDTVRSVDSSWALRVQEPYLAVKTGYDTAKSTYDTDKTAYETAFNANAKDGKTTVPTRPDKPTVPAAFSGAVIELSNQVSASPDSWTGTTSPGFKAKTGTEMVLATGGTVAAPTYTQTQIDTHFHNRYAYYRVAATQATAFVAATNEVSAAWGRLGQSATMDITNGSPFYWGTPASGGAQRPGMQISVLPEMSPASSPTLTDWALGSATEAVQISVKTASFTALSTYEAPSTPTAATAISVGAQALAASMVAAAAVAATMF